MHNKIRNLNWLIISLLVVISDQLIKNLISNHFDRFEVFPLLPFLNLTLNHNTGAAFSFLANAGGWQHFFFCGIALVMSIVLVIWLYRLERGQRWTAIALALIIGGAIGNLWDRLVLGYVVDYIDFYIKSWHYATFNLADSTICIGAAMLIIEAVFFQKKL